MTDINGDGSKELITGENATWPIMATMRGSEMRQFFFILNLLAAKNLISKNIKSTHDSGAGLNIVVEI